MKVLKALLKILGYPISFLWQEVYRLRRFLYSYDFFRRHEFLVPVISVGNITFGGTGKTPFTVWLGNYFASQNKKVMILSRGYKGRLENKFGILRTGKKLGFDPYDYGDEAILMVKKLKNACVVVGKKRSQNLEYYFDQERPDVVILDDGHQHIQLKRRLNIVLFDSLMPLEKYKVAPLGYLREGLSGLKDADFVIIGRSDQSAQKKIDDLIQLIQPYMKEKTPIANIRYVPSGLFDLNFRKVKSYEDLKGKKVIAVAGIATPESFLKLLKASQADIVDKHIFPDHHKFGYSEMSKIIDQASETDSIIVTTEKDIVKMRRVVENDNIFFLEVKVDFISGENELLELVEQCIDYKYV